MKGLSQEELGKLLHISRQIISKWESNQSSPDIQSCKAMADVFGISLEELLDESKKIKTDQSTNHRNMIIIFGIVIFVIIIMESYVAVKMSERIDVLEEANASLQQQINDFYGDQPISLDTNSICSYFSGYISDIKKDSYNINIDLILKNYQDNTPAQVIFKTDKDTYTLSLNKEEDPFNGTINLSIQTLQSTQLISQTNGETNSEVLDIDVNFENYLDEDASGGIMLESYNKKKNKGDFTLSFSGNKTKKDEIYLWDKEYNFKRNTEYHDVKGTIYINGDKKKTVVLNQINSDKEYIEFEKAYTCKNIKKEDTVMVEYTYINEMGIKKKQ
ncbi:MAG TPA: helix-turn-helix transcriptional regulator [Coprobacillaceae bacterium]|nr:helix-turn-helix transcriptional regulator [Coprobacillaceae bacterium]